MLLNGQTKHLCTVKHFTNVLLCKCEINILYLIGEVEENNYAPIHIEFQFYYLFEYSKINETIII